MRVVRVNKEREKSNTYYTDMLATTLQQTEQDNSKQTLDHMDNILDIRYLHKFFSILFSFFF